MKNLTSLKGAKTLNINEQKTINGGKLAGVDCSNIENACKPCNSAGWICSCFVCVDINEHGGCLK